MIAIAEMLQEEILTQYELYLPLLEEIRRGVETRLSELIRRESIKTHSVSGRLKSKESLRAKISRPDKTYRALWEVTDLLGLRITTYFEDTIEDVAALIERSFAVDFHLSVDRLQSSDFRNFGYRSLHYVCEWEKREHRGLVAPGEFRFEIQIRTILQHAWAEIEHDLGYKAGDPTPGSIRRRFSRIAGLLEIADQEFVSIRRDLRSYAASVKDSLSDPSRSFPLDLISLQSIATAPEVSSLDREIGRILNKDLGDTIFFPEYLLKMLKLAGYKTTHDVKADLAANRDLVLEAVPPYFDFTGKTWKLTANDLEFVPLGYSLFFLSHVAILKSPILDQNKVTKVAQFYRELDYYDDEKSAYRVAIGLLDAFKRAGCPRVL